MVKKFLQYMEDSLKNLRIADLEVFISAARMKNLGKAAASHHLSQSAASTAVQRVETAFKIPLCMHERRRFQLTREGQVLLPKLEELVRQVRELSACSDIPCVRLVSTHAIAQVVIPSLLSLYKMEFKHMRLDQAYAAVLQAEADMAIVLDNSPWKGVIRKEIGKGSFQLYCRHPDIALKPVLLPEDQMEVLFLQQNWLQEHGSALPIKARIASWSLIGQICEATDEIGFLPDFLAKKFKLFPVLWQPTPTPYRILAIHREEKGQLQERFCEVFACLSQIFSGI